MITYLPNKVFNSTSYRYLLFIFLTILFIIILQSLIPKIKNIDFQVLNIKSSLNQKMSSNSFSTETNEHILSFSNSISNHHNKTLETTIQCVGSLYNQSCLYTNLYYVNSTFMILTVKGTYLPPHAVRTDAFNLWNLTPNKRVFDTYADLEKFVRTIIQPKVIPSVTVHFGQPWHFNIGHALFDGLYPAYVALIRFSPRHLLPFRILAGIENCKDCWSEDVYSRFAGLGLLKLSVLNQMSKGKWFMFDEIVMGSGTLCQRCNQPNLQLPGGVELDGSRLFRDRMYQQHGLIPPLVRHRSSSEGRTSHDLLLAYIIDNKRFTDNDRKQINDAINEINNYANSYRNKPLDKSTKLEWPLVNVTYLRYGQVKAENVSLSSINKTLVDSRSPTYELVDNNFIAQLKILHRMDIHLSGPGTGQMYQTFLSDGSVNINLGGIKPWGLENTDQAFTSYLEQHMTSGAPYMRGLYYPINERPKGIKKEEVIKLIREAGRLILEGFPLPVNPRENLAADGQVFVEMCEKDKKFCSFVTTRSPDKHFSCIDLWVEDVVQEHRQWSLEGFTDKNRSIICPFNHALLRKLRNKYGINYRSYNRTSKQF